MLLFLEILYRNYIYRPMLSRDERSIYRRDREMLSLIFICINLIVVLVFVDFVCLFFVDLFFNFYHHYYFLQAIRLRYKKST